LADSAGLISLGRVCTSYGPREYCNKLSGPVTGFEGTLLGKGEGREREGRRGMEKGKGKKEMEGRNEKQHKTKFVFATVVGPRPS